MNRILIVGCGFVGNELVRQVNAVKASHLQPSSDAQYSLYALTRTVARADGLKKMGVEPIVGHWHDPDSLQALPQVDTILVSVPHREDSGFGVESHVVGLKNLHRHLPSTRKWIYLSTTGVYGEAHDEVDELTPTQPTRVGPQIAVAAENFLTSQFPAPQLAIVRLAGIYGPGRIPLAEKLKAGETLQVPQQGWLNLAHVADIATMLLQVCERDLKDTLYVFSDGQPVNRLEFYSTLARLCGVEEPKFAEPDPTSSRSQRAGKKRINPQRILVELKFELQFPSYKEGLSNCLR